MSLASAMPSQFNLHDCLRIQRLLPLIKRSFKQFVPSNELFFAKFSKPIIKDGEKYERKFQLLTTC